MITIFFVIVTLHEPQSYRKSSIDPHWQQVVDDELHALKKTHTWDLVNLFIGKIVSCKCVYKIKTYSDGYVECYKAFLVAKGYAQ